MSETKNGAAFDASPQPVDSTPQSAISRKILPEPEQLSNLSLCRRTQSGLVQPGAVARPMPVQPLSEMPVQEVCCLPVYPLSAEQANTGRTGCAQALSTQDAQGLNMLGAQTVGSQNEQGADRLHGQDMDSHDERPPDRRNEQTEPVFLLRHDMASWTANQEKLLEFFKACGHCVTNHKAIGERFGIPYGTVRNIIRRLTTAGFLQCRPYRDKAIQGIEVWYCGPVVERTAQDKNAVAMYWATGSEQPVKTAAEQPEWTGAGRPFHIEEGEKESENTQKNLSIWNLSMEHIDALWPHVRKAGLFSSHLREVKTALELQGIEGRPEKLVAQTLRFLDWQLSKGPIIDQHGKEVGDPIAYWRAAMKRNGYYQKPVGYVDREELALQQLIAEENKKVEAGRKLEQLRREKEKLERRDELDEILRALANEQEQHPLWEQVCDKWSQNTQAEVSKNPQAIVNSPGVAATTRIALRAIFGWPE